jgi:hypothetical protein
VHEILTIQNRHETNDGTSDTTTLLTPTGATEGTDVYFDHINLTDDQKDLLQEMVEAERNIPKKARRKFAHLKSAGGGWIHHPGFPDGEIEVYEGDVTELQAKGFLNVTFGGSGTPNYMLTAEAFEYYKHLKTEEGQPVGSLEEEVTRFLETGRLAAAYPEAHGKWSAAAEMLWTPEAEDKLTKIGHDCREAMQAFATALVEKFDPDDVDENPAHTVNRVRAVLLELQFEGEVGRTQRRYLEGLLEYWKRLNRLVQRQEHDEDVVEWEDARAVVFGTGYAMYEIDRAVRDDHG